MKCYGYELYLLGVFADLMDFNVTSKFYCNPKGMYVENGRRPHVFMCEELSLFSKDLEHLRATWKVPSHVI